MIRVWCDHCDEQVPRDVYAVVEVYAGKGSDSKTRFHLCEPCQALFAQMVGEFTPHAIGPVRR